MKDIWNLLQRILIRLKIVEDNSGGGGGSDNNYTDTDKAKVDNLSGVNTGDQDLSGKVDKDGVKQLSDQNYTLTEKNKLAAFPGNISQFTNDSGYLTAVPGNYLTTTGAQAVSNKTGPISQWTNDVSYLTAITGAQVNTALGGNFASDAEITAGNTLKAVNGSGVKNHVATAIANLIASSPSTLDTLDELAAALGDDPNFATTVATNIGLKAPIDNPTFTGTVTFPQGSLTVPALKIPVSSNLLGTPQAGAIEAFGDKLYYTFPTGPTRSEILHTAAVGGLTTGRVAYATTNGRIVDNSQFLFASAAGGKLSIGTTSNTSNLNVGSNVQTSGIPILASFTGAAHTGMTLSTEVPSILFDLSATKQWATGAITTQREIKILAPTYSAIAATVMTTGVTFSIIGPPVAGTNMTITNPLAFEVESGISRFGGNILFSGSGGAINIASTNVWLGTVYSAVIAGKTGLNLRTGSTGGALLFGEISAGNEMGGFFATSRNFFINASPGAVPADSGEKAQINGNIETTKTGGGAFITLDTATGVRKFVRVTNNVVTVATS